MNPAENIIGKFGGLTGTARALAGQGKTVAVSTVQGWKERKRIPQEYWLPLVEAGKELGSEIDLSMFLTADAAQTEAAE